MPYTVSLASEDAALADLAEGLLAERILKSTDWAGDLAQSIEDGLRRWFFLEMEVGSMKLLAFDLLYTDNVECASAEGEAGDDPGHYYLDGYAGRWVKEYGRPSKKDEPSPQVGTFVLGCGDGLYNEYYGSVVFVGRAVAALNLIYPGAGYAVFGLAQDMLRDTVGIAGPEWGLRLLRWMGGFRSGDGLELDYAEPRFAARTTAPKLTQKQVDRAANRHYEQSVLKFRRQAPRGFFTAAWRPKPAQRALKLLAGSPAGSSHPLLREALETAVELAAHVEALPAAERFSLNEWSFFNSEGEELTPPALLRWDRDDLLGRLFDDYIEMAAENAGWTTMVWHKGWQAGQPETLRRCLRGLRYTARTLVLCDRILNCLHTYSQEPVENRVRVPLCA